MGLQDVPSHHMWVNVLRIPVSVAHKLGLHLERYRRVQPGPCRLPAQEIGQLAGNYSVAQVLAGYRDSSEVS